MRESDLLAHIFARSKGLPPHVLLGPGDDCAVLEISGSQLLLKVDQLVESRHFTPETPIDLIARKAFARAVSDIAAMGGRPSASLCAALLPHNYPHADALFDACQRWANNFLAPLVGGDIASFASKQSGPLTLSITLLGTPHPTRGPVLRGTAQPGDDVYVSGKLGNSFASGRHLTFTPRVELASALCDSLGLRLHSMMDLSDGLGKDASRLALASRAVIELDPRSLPLHSDCPDWRRGASEGEDYELLFTSPSPLPPELLGIPLTRVGRVLEAAAGSPPGAHILHADGRREDSRDMGWEHA